MDEIPAYVLTIEELAAYRKIPKSTLSRLVREGKIPPENRPSLAFSERSH
jgi:hypothetical protein